MSKTFYRTMYIRNDLNLFQIGVGILISLRAEFEHMFLFHDKGSSYMDASWVEGTNSPRRPALDYTKVHLSDLTLNASNEFTLNMIPVTAGILQLKYIKPSNSLMRKKIVIEL